MKGELFVLSAPSGTGKTTLIRRLMRSEVAAAGKLAFSVSHTTRNPRRGEVEGSDYYFVDLATFEEMISADRFLEWAEVYGHYKGTSLEEVLPRLERGTDVVLDIDVQGAEQVIRRYPEVHSIFIMPPSYRALEQRLRSRGLDDPGEISRRLAVSLSEMERYSSYQYVIINRDASRAGEILAAIILEKRHRLKRMEERVGRVLQDFRSTQEGTAGPGA